MKASVRFIFLFITLTSMLAGCGRTMLGESGFKSMDRRTEPALTRLEGEPGAPASSTSEPAWQENYASALYEAGTSNKMVLAFFTGSDWCTWCKKLEREVLSKPEFAGWSKDRFVLLKVDYPRTSRQPEDVMVQNRDLAKRYSEFIDGYPTILFLDSDGQVLGRMGYSTGGPGPWIQKASLQLPPAG